MTALLAAGGGLPLALRIPHVVEQIGSIAGFAAVVGLAILSALYMSAARDLRRLREWAGRAPERAAEGVPGRVPPAPATAAGGAAGPRVVQKVPQAQPQTATAAGTSNGSPPEADKDQEAKEGQEADAAKAAGEGTQAAPATTAEGAEATDGDKPDGEGKDGDGKQAPRAPGMPAPASAAAAAAGAKAASATGPAASAAPAASTAAKPASGSAATPASTTPDAPKPAPATPAGPKPAPTRPSTSVLPPRAPAPPVRRIGATSPGGRPQPGLVREPEPAKRKRNPVYVALAVVGVLILGAGAAIGVPKLVEGDSSDSGKTASSSKKSAAKTAKKPTPNASKITVAVLNGTTVPGLAADIGDRVEASGFTKGTVDNAVGPQRANSVVKYSPGHQSDARLVAKKLKIGTIEAMDPTSQGIAGDATVVVVVGSDQTR